MERRDRIDGFGAACLFSTALIMGLNQVFIKLVNAGLQPVFQVGLRSAFAIVPILAFAFIARRKLSISDGSLIPGILCGLLFAFEFMLLFPALEFTTVSRASIMFYTMPFWLAVAAHFLIPGEQLNRFKIAGLALAIAGIVLAFYDPDEQAAFKERRLRLGSLSSGVAGANPKLRQRCQQRTECLLRQSQQHRQQR